MKKYSLLLACVLFVSSVLAQTYEVKVSVGLLTKTHHMECNTRAEVKVYSSGSLIKEWTPSVWPNEYNNGSWFTRSTSFYIYNENPLTITCNGIHEDDPTGPGGCKVRGRDSKTIYVSASDFPCISKSATGLLGTYDNGSYIKVEIKPLGVSLQYSNPNMDSRYRDTLVLPDKHRITIRAVENYTSSAYIWQYQSGNEATVRDLWAPYYLTHQDGDYIDPMDPYRPQPSDPICIPYNPDNDNCFHCYTYDPSPYSSDPCIRDYGGYWRYKQTFVGSGWINLSRFNQQREISFSGEDLFGSNFLSYIEAGKQFQFRIDYGCGQSKIITLDPWKSAPTIIDTAVIPNLCYGDSLAIVKVRLSERLADGETLTLGLGWLDTLSVNITHADLDENNWYTFPGRYSAGTYSVTTLGKYKGYPSYTAAVDHSRTITIVDPPKLTLSTSKTDVNCIGGEDGAIRLTIGGGKPPYSVTYKRDGGALQAASNPFMISGLAAGTYQIWLQDSNNCRPKDPYGQEISPVITITQPADSVRLQLMAAPIHPSGWKKMDGTISVIAEGGSPASSTPYYTYMWTKNNANMPVYTNVVNGLGDGQYHVTAYDSKFSAAYGTGLEKNYRGCMDTLRVVLTQPDSLQVQLAVEDSITCYGNNDGKLSAHIQGGVKPYATLYWEKWTGSAWQHQSSSVDSTLSNAAAGSYRLTVTDSRGNSTVSPELHLVQPDTLKVAHFLQSQPSCYGYSNGWVEPVVSGGTAPYTYRWLEAVPNPDTIRLTGLAKGSYDIKVTDRNGCTTFAAVALNQPDTLTITPVITLPSAYNASNGAIQLNVSGGTPAYSYLWAHNSATSNPLTGLAANDTPYHVTVTDANGCSKSAHPRIIFPLGVQVQLRDSIRCSGEGNGKLAAWATGGVGTDYRYQWYKVMGGTPQTIGTNDSLLTNIGAGIYRVRVTDVEGNTATSSDFTFDSPDSLKVQLTPRALKCKFDTDGQIEAFPSGGTAPYSYLWSNGQTAKKAVNLTEGSYTVTLTDSRGCFVAEQSAVTSPAELLITVHYIPPRAYNYSDASVWVRATGGTAPYTYAWQGRGETTDSISGVPHGSYTAIVTDANGCSKQLSVVVPNPPLLEAFVAESRVISCYGRSDGQLSASSQGGVGAHRYTWYRVGDGTPVQVSTGSTLNGIPAGTYQLKVTDANNIDAYSTVFTLTQPSVLQASASANSLVCNGDTNGWVQAAVTGGTQPYAYSWTSGHTTARVEGLTDDKYLVLVTDARGCEAKAQAEITVPAGLVVTAEVVHPTCHNSNNGTVRLNVSGGVAPYTYTWSNGTGGASLNSVAGGVHNVTVRGANGCFKTIRYSLDNPEPISINLGGDRTLCKGQTVEVNATITDPQAQYKWYKNGTLLASTPVVTLSEAGSYRVEATDSKGCTGEGSLTVYSSAKDLSADFMVSSKVGRGEKCKLVNLSYPLPEQTEWLIPDDPNISIISQTDEQLELVFHQNGNYTVGLRSGEGQCERSVYKLVTVVDKYDLPEYETPKEAFLKQFIVYPNPSRGQFTVRIELGEVADVQLRLVNMMGITVDERKANGSNYYELTYNLSVTQGIYVLQLLSKKANTSVKLMLTQ